MTKVTVDENLQSKLNGLNAEIVFCDPSGRTLGHFLPEEIYKKLLYASDSCPFTEEELRRHMDEPGGCTLAEIWQRLGRK
jgi:hypothetical protein